MSGLVRKLLDWSRVARLLAAVGGLRARPDTSRRQAEREALQRLASTGQPLWRPDPQMVREQMDARAHLTQSE